MKGISKTLRNIIVALYILGSITSAYLLYRLEDNLVRRTDVVDRLNIQEISPILTELNFVVGSVLFIGLIGLVLFFLNRSNVDEENVVYVETYKKAGESEDGQYNSDGESVDVQEMSKIQSILNNGYDKREALSKVLSVMSNSLEASQAALFERSGTAHTYELSAGYAYSRPDSDKLQYELGEGIVGQVAKEGKLVNINNVPEGYIKVLSGLGESQPGHLLVCPVQVKANVLAVVEIASFKPFTKNDESYVKSVAEGISEVLSKEKA